MAWYYKDGEQEVGPVEKADLQALIKSKQINAQTMVRSDNSDEWKPLAELVRSKAQADNAPPVEEQPEQASRAQASGLQMENPELTEEAASQQPVPPAPPAQGTSVCSQCGRSFPNDQVLTYEGQIICAACKPMFVQKLKEGVGVVGGALNYAGFWIRLVAKIIDGIIMAIVQWVILIPLSLMQMGSMSQGGEPGAGFFLLMAVQQIVGIVIPAAYNTFFIGKFAATPGKMACRLKVVTAENESVSYMRALGRNFAEWISAIILLIGYIMAGFDEEKRALHDRICNTRVVHK